jgi:hypothetical protein
MTNAMETGKIDNPFLEIIIYSPSVREEKRASSRVMIEFIQNSNHKFLKTSQSTEGIAVQVKHMNTSPKISPSLSKHRGLDRILGIEEGEDVVDNMVRQITESIFVLRTANFRASLPHSHFINLMCPLPIIS